MRLQAEPIRRSSCEGEEKVDCIRGAETSSLSSVTEFCLKFLLFKTTRFASSVPDRMVPLIFSTADKRTRKTKSKKTKAFTSMKTHLDSQVLIKKTKKKHKNSIFKTFFQNEIHVCLGAIFQLCNLTQARPRISGGIKMLHNFLIENRAGGVETILGPEP